MASWAAFWQSGRRWAVGSRRGAFLVYRDVYRSASATLRSSSRRLIAGCRRRSDMNDQNRPLEPNSICSISIPTTPTTMATGWPSRVTRILPRWASSTQFSKLASPMGMFFTISPRLSYVVVCVESHELPRGARLRPHRKKRGNHLPAIAKSASHAPRAASRPTRLSYGAFPSRVRGLAAPQYGPAPSCDQTHEGSGDSFSVVDGVHATGTLLLYSESGGCESRQGPFLARPGDI